MSQRSTMEEILEDRTPEENVAMEADIRTYTMREVKRMIENLRQLVLRREEELAFWEGAMGEDI